MKEILTAGESHAIRKSNTSPILRQSMVTARFRIPARWAACGLGPRYWPCSC